MHLYHAVINFFVEHQQQFPVFCDMQSGGIISNAFFLSWLYIDIITPLKF